MRRVPILLACIALAALVAGLVPAASRWYAERNREVAFEQQRRAVRAETEAQTAELAVKKPQVLAELGALQAAGEHEKVLAKASRYRLANDREVQALYAQSAAQVNLKQTLQRMTAFAQAQCTSGNAVESAREAFAQAFPEAQPVVTTNWSAQRLETAAVAQPIRERLRALIDATDKRASLAHGQAQSGSALDALRGDHPPRLHPAVLLQLMRDTPEFPAVCVWHIAGTWGAAGQAGTPGKPFAMTMWLAPSATERTMTRDVLSLQGL